MPDDLVPDDFAPALPAFLERQRWFAAKGRRIAGVRVVDAAPLWPGPPAQLVAAVVDVELGGEVQRYQMPIGLRRGADADAFAARSPAAVIHRAHAGAQTRVAYDALADPELARRLLDLLSGAADRDGPVRFARAPGAGQLVLSRMPAFPARPLGVEQSNSSVVVGDAVILKVFRRLQAGENPELELTRALAAQGFTACAQPLAWAEGFGATLMMLQRFYSGAADGYTLAVQSAVAGDFRAESFALGEVVAEMHEALRAVFPPLPPDETVLAGEIARWHGELASAVAQVPALGTLAPAVAGAYRRAARSGGHADMQRIHGDLHLGQVLQTAAGWIVIDFEGEPARPIAQRRRPASPLRDVAGMLRSFDYAAYQPLLGDARGGPGLASAAAWAGACRDAFLDAYRQHAPARPGPLLQAYELHKAIYEVSYEASHRPAWVGVPLGGIERILAGDPGD